MDSQDVNSATCVVLGTEVTGEQEIELRLSVHIDKDTAPEFLSLVRQGALKCKKIDLGALEKTVSGSHGVAKNSGELQLSFEAVDEKSDFCKQMPSKTRNRSGKGNSASNVDSSQESAKTDEKDQINIDDKSRKVVDATVNSLSIDSFIPATLEDTDSKSRESKKGRRKKANETITKKESEGKTIKEEEKEGQNTSSPAPTTVRRSRRSREVSATKTVLELPISPDGASSLRRSSRSTKSRFRRRDEGIEQNLTDTPVKGSTSKASQLIDKEESKPTRKRGRKPKAHAKSPQKRPVKSSSPRKQNDVYSSDEDNMDDICFVDDDNDDPDFVMQGVEDKIVTHVDKDEEATTEGKVGTKKKNGITTDEKDDAPKCKRVKLSHTSKTKQGPVIVVPNGNPFKEEYECAVCYRSFALKRNLLRHVLRAGSQKFTCSICEATFHNQKEVDQHNLAHSGEHRYLCEVCHLSFRTYRAVNKHVKIHLPPHDRPFICKECGKGFTESTGLHYHMFVHAEDRPHKCPHCDSKFAAVFLLQSHLKYHSNRKFRCYTCNREYKLFQSLKEHLFIYKSHYTEDKPDPVEKVTKTPAKTERHASRKIERSESKSNLSDSDAELMSLIDGPNVSSKAVEPENSTNPVDDDVSSVSETKVLPKFLKKALTGKVKCKICFRHYSNINHLNRHYRAYGKICYECKLCNAKFHRKEDRSQHKLVHDGTNNFQCKVCFKSFKHMSTVKKHTLTHLPTNRRPFSCDICDKGFTCQLELDNHKWSHNKTEDNKCPECGELFRTWYLLERHINVHQGTVYKCKTCIKQYRYPSSLKDHLVATGHIGDDTSSPRRAKPMKKKNYSPKNDTDTTVMCEICGLTVDKASLKQHKKLHKLGRDVDENSEALRHFAFEKYQERIQASKETLKKSSNNNQRQSCPLCDKEFKNKQSLRKHTVMKHGEGRFKCNLCSRKFYMPQELKDHMFRHTGERTVRCEKCTQTFFFESDLRKHMKIHLSYEERRFKCGQCGKKFLEACFLREHMAWHSGKKPFKCETCDKTFCSRTQLRSHKATHGGLVKCQYCPKTFKLTSSLSSHVRQKHSDNPPSHLCEHCGKSFNTKGGLKKHWLKHTSNAEFCCDSPECGKKFFTSADLRMHQKSHCEDRPFTCNTCGKAYKSACALKNHMNSHLQTKPFTCEICLKSLSTSKRLKEHMEKHLGERSFQCEKCPSKFYTKSALAYHRKSHLSTYECQECRKIFKLKTRLKSHMKIHEGPERTQCPKCNVFYKDVNYLQTSHLKVCDPNKFCPYCSRKFTKMRTLQAHIGFHSGVRPFHCDTCGHAFPKQELLNTHIEMHNWKKYPCSKCGKRFTRASELKKHLRFHLKQETVQKRIQDYKERLGNSEKKSDLKEIILSPGTYISQSQGTKSLVDPEQIKKEFESQLQKPRDILEEAAYVSIDSQTKFEVVQEDELQGETVVQYIQTDQGYTQVVQLEDGSLLHGSLMPQEGAEQVVITTIDADQLQGHGANEIIMVAMVPSTE